MIISKLLFAIIVVFNFALILIFQPEFIFKALKLREKKEKILRKSLLGLGLICIIILAFLSYKFAKLISQNSVL
jgi:hypothetical protein